MKQFCALIAFLGFLSSAFAQEDLNLRYTKPAEKWEEALPLGSGRLGAMVFGGVVDERIQFNEDTLWTGKPHNYVREGAQGYLKQIQELVFKNTEEAEKEVAGIVRKNFLSDPVRQKAFQPFGDIRLHFPGHENVTDYQRTLDLDSALATVTYRMGDVTFKREAFASYPDHVIALRLTASKPGSISCTIKLDTPHKNASTKVEGDTLILTGQVQDTVEPKEMGMKFEGRLKVIATGGSVKGGQDAIEVLAADSLVLLQVAATDYVSWEDISGDPAAKCRDYLKAIEGKSFEALRSAQQSDHQKLFRRVTLDLGKTDRANLTTDERLKKVTAGSNVPGTTGKNAPSPTNLPKEGLDSDPALASLYFQMGRYMLICSSRPGTQPANLQGVWNELLNPPWESKYTTNINAQMNYWPSEVANLSECGEPLFKMIDELAVSGGRTAKQQYNARGWVVHHNTDFWRGTAPINNIDGVWPTGGAWLCYHLWEHYLFTRDRDFLAKAYPAMKGASQFFVDTLVKDPKTGLLVTNPSISPEQGPLVAGPAMDMQLVRAVFDCTTASAEILGIDSDVVSQIRDVRKQLMPDQVGKHRQLQEWKEDIDEPNNNHRHMSPLWGLFPGAQFTPNEPKLYDAAKLLLKWRGDGSTGWSYAWRMPLWARVNDGDFAYRQLYLQLGKRTFPNLFDKCGPFQVDGNFGATAGIAEMLLQSHVMVPDSGKPIIEVLPALPSAWAKGSFTGLLARGGFEVDASWEDGKLTKATIKSNLGQPCKVKFGDKMIDLATEKGKSYILDGSLAHTN